MDTNAGASHAYEVHLRDVWSLLVRNWWVIGLTVLVVASATVAYTLYSVPLFQSSTTILIAEERGQVPVLDVLQNLSTGSEVETEMEVVRSRTLTEAVVDSLGLQVRVAKPRGVARVELLTSIFVEEWAPKGLYTLDRQPDGTFLITLEATEETFGTTSPTQPAALPGATFRLTEAAAEYEQIVVSVRSFEAAVTELMQTLSVSRPNREASIITVRYQSTDTQFVREIPNVLASTYIEQGQAFRKTEATSTVTFLSEQIDTLDGQLRRAEEALTAFREGEQVVSIQAEAEAQVTNLSRLQAERNIIEAERAALQRLVDEIDLEAQTVDPTAPSPYNRLISFPPLFRNQAASELLRTLSDANAERSQLLLRRTVQDPDVVNLTERIKEIETRLRATATGYLRGLTEQVDGYDRTLAQFATDLERIPAKEVQFIRLERETKVLEEVYTLLQNRLQEARILEAVKDANVRVVDPAVLPADPIKPRPMLNLILGLFLGGLLGVGIAFLREYLDDTVHTSEDVQQATKGVSVLGMIPRIRDAVGRGRTSEKGAPGELNSRLIAGRDPRNPVSEAYRNLRTNLTFANPDHPPRTMVITSALPQDGKSTSAANLAITLAQQGTRVLLVDADLRRGVLNQVFDTPREPGLTTLLTRSVSDFAAAVRTVDLGESGSLDFMPSGGYPPNPAEILGSQRMRALIESLEERYDLVILDTAPLTMVTDAAVLGTNADGVILVARANRTAKGALSYSAEQLRNVRATILGCVINDVDFRRDSRYSSAYGRYGYYYHYYYSDGQKGSKRREKKGRKTPA